MINFTLGVLSCGILLITIYFTLFSRRKIINYRRNDHLERLISQKDFEFLLIDLRSVEEYEKSHIPTAVSIPFEELILSLPVENMFLTIIVYGGRGKVSHTAAEYLSSNGYFNVTSFGAFSRWKGDLNRNELIGDTHIENSGKGRVNFPV